MTNTDTADARATADQIIELAEAGSELVRIYGQYSRGSGPGRSHR
jgi:4-hydroxy-3-methylbut-2-en-1-yl diphosphate synthase IspG/GcpE